MKCHRGYTLIEILIVIVIISIVTSMALLSIGRSQDRQMKNLTQQISQTIQLAEEQALLQPAVFSVAVDDERIVVFKRQYKNKAAKWVPAEETGLQPIAIPNNLHVEIDVPGSEASRIVISGNAELTPFELKVSSQEDDAKQYILKGTTDGGLSYEEPN